MTIQFVEEDIVSIADAARVFNPDNVWVHVSASGARVEMIDPAVAEKISIQVVTPLEYKDVIGYKYSTDVFLKLINQKKVPVITATLYNNGLLKIPYRGIDVHMLKRQGL